MLSVAQGVSLERLPSQGPLAVWAGKLAFCVREGCLFTDAVKWLKLQDQDLEESFAMTCESSKEERPPDTAGQGP